MDKIKTIMAKKKNQEEQELKNILRNNIKKYRQRRKWSQLTLASKIDISTNFLADIEAGNTWISAQTLVKLAKVFEIEAYELLIPEKEEINNKNNTNKKILGQFSKDLSIAMQESIDKAIVHVKKEYKII